MEPHDDKTRFFEKMDKVLKGVIVLTCLTGVIAVAWLCTAGKAKAQETAKVTPETAAADTEPAAESALWETEAEVPAEIPEETLAAETENYTETETEDNAAVTARAVPMIPYGYENKTETEAEPEDVPDEDQFASADEAYGYDYRESWPQSGKIPGGRNHNRAYGNPYDNQYEWPSDHANEYWPQEAQIYFFWF